MKLKLIIIFQSRLDGNYFNFCSEIQNPKNFLVNFIVLSAQQFILKSVSKYTGDSDTREYNLWWRQLSAKAKSCFTLVLWFSGNGFSNISCIITIHTSTERNFGTLLKCRIKPYALTSWAFERTSGRLHFEYFLFRWFDLVNSYFKH